MTFRVVECEVEVQVEHTLGTEQIAVTTRIPEATMNWLTLKWQNRTERPVE